MSRWVSKHWLVHVDFVMGEQCLHVSGSFAWERVWFVMGTRGEGAGAMVWHLL